MPRTSARQRDLIRRLADALRGSRKHAPLVREADEWLAQPRRLLGRPVSVTREQAEAALEKADGNKTAAAKSLGVSRQTLITALGRP